MTSKNNVVKSLTLDEISESEKPRNGEGYERPGAYNIATVGNLSVADPGAKLKFEQYITGYGEIKGAKIVVFLSPDLIDIKESIIQHSLGGVGNELKFGVGKFPIENNSFAFTFGGMAAKKWKSETMLFDINNSSPPFIATEQFIGLDKTAPFTYSIKLRDDIKPGDYSMDFYFTYFNGDKWSCVKEQVKFKVRNIFERYSVWFSLLAVVATLTGIANVMIRLICGL